VVWRSLNSGEIWATTGGISMQKRLRRIGLLTGGGDCPGLNGVIRAVVKTAVHDYGMQVVGFKDGYYGLVKNLAVKLDYDDVSGIITKGGTILGTSNKANPFAFVVGKGKRMHKVDLSGRVFETVRKRRVSALVIAGGDGTLSIAKRLADKGLHLVGIPKTIDNDLMETDFTFGFDSAVQTASEAIDKIHDTAQSHHRVMIVETMGRYTGWLALHSAVASGGDVILIPEIPYRIEKVCQEVKNRSRRGRRSSIVVIAEGARPVGGKMFVRDRIKTSPDPIRLGGIGNILGKDIKRLTGLETRVTVLGHIQRGGTPTAFDRVLATRFGTQAVRLLVEGRFGEMVALQGNEIRSVPLALAVRDIKRVPPEHPLIQTARAVGSVFGD